VLISVHEEQMLEAVAERYPARHYVIVDDKLRILSTRKKARGDRLTSIFPGRAMTRSTTSTASPIRRQIRRPRELAIWSNMIWRPCSGAPTPDLRDRSNS